MKDESGHSAQPALTSALLLTTVRIGVLLALPLRPVGVAGMAPLIW